MIPITPGFPGPALAPADPQLRATTAGAETSAAAPPALGLSAVTAAQATKALSPRADPRDAPPDTGARVDPLEPPADPPPLKGLGIPPLDMTQVGDQDKEEAPAVSANQHDSGLRARLADLDHREAHSVDIRR